MPRWLRHFLRSRSLKQHLWLSLCLGAMLRVLCAIFVYGPQALDDYKHGVWPAYQFFAGQVMDLPDYRSHLLVWMLSGFISLASMLGVTSALAQVRAMYLGLGAISLIGVYGTFLFVQTFRSRTFAALALYLIAVFPLMPFIGTRAFGEAVATSLVLLSFGILERTRRLEEQGTSQSAAMWLIGFLCLGLASLFRFHVGLLYVAYGGTLLAKQNWRAAGIGIVSGLATVAAQYGIDFLSHKQAFGTLVAYLEENEGGAVKYGVSPWYNTWAFVMALTLAPFSFVFTKKIPALWRKHWPWLVPFLVFVTAHSLVAHKEERFMYPIVGLELWALAWLWASSALMPLARRFYSRAFFAISLPLLLVVCFVNSQEGEIEPPAFAEKKYSHVVYLDHESLFGMSRFQFYFLRPPSVLQAVPKGDFSANKIDSALTENPMAKAVVLLTSVPDVRDQLHALEGVKTTEATCQTTRAAGSLIDQLIYSLNPKHNERRRPTWYLVCERG